MVFLSRFTQRIFVISAAQRALPADIDALDMRNRRLFLFSEPFNAKPHRLPDIQLDRFRFLPQPDARRRAGRDDVARLKAHELRDVGDNLID